MTDKAAVEFFRAHHAQDPSNTVCFDCGTDAPQWASISHGIYISIEASGVHRSLGVNVSYVQSTSMDSWKPVHLRMMELGGNQRFKDFLREQGVPEDLPIRQKYHTRAAEWYRKNLRAMAEGCETPPPLPAGTGHLPAEGCSSPEQQVLDRVFAKAPLTAAMTQGGVLASASRRSRSSHGGSSPSGASAKKRSRSTYGKSSEKVSPRLGLAEAFPKLLGRSSSGSSSSDASVSPRRPSTMSEQLYRLLMSDGDRAAERLRTMSTGKMQGFGPVDCGMVANQAEAAQHWSFLQAAAIAA